LQLHVKPALFLLAALFAAASMWFYVDRILIGHQLADAASHERPRGNLSDLYPRWLGARELLLHRRNPYSEDITLEIQKGYYGRALDPSRPNDPRDQQGFAYPVYVVFLLAPFVGFSFHPVQIVFYWLLLGLTAVSVGLWLRVLQWRLRPMEIAACVVLALGSFPVVQGIKLQQLSVLVAALFSASVACVAGGWLFCGGILLALATIKPQLAWPLVVWLLCWAASDWGRRRKLVYGFVSMMGLLLVGGEIVLPGWWRMFAGAIRQYQQYTQNQSVLNALTPWSFVGKILEASAVFACVFFLWRLRGEFSSPRIFGRAAAVVLALTVLVAPMSSPYNQVLLLPAVLLLAREQATFLSQSSARRLAYEMGGVIVGWQWIASLGLTTVYWSISRASALDHWNWPVFATFALPIWIFVLLFFHTLTEYMQTENAQSQSGLAGEQLS
jgi:hypothetical protein